MTTGAPYWALAMVAIARPRCCDVVSMRTQVKLQCASGRVTFYRPLGLLGPRSAAAGGAGMHIPWRTMYLNHSSVSQAALVPHTCDRVRRSSGGAVCASASSAAGAVPEPSGSDSAQQQDQVDSPQSRCGIHLVFGADAPYARTLLAALTIPPLPPLPPLPLAAAAAATGAG